MNSVHSVHSFLRGFELANWIDFYWIKRASLQYESASSPLFHLVGEVQDFPSLLFPPAKESAHRVLFAAAVSCSEDESVPNWKFCRAVESVLSLYVQGQRWDSLSRSEKLFLAKKIAELLPLRSEDADHPLDCNLQLEPADRPLVEEVLLRLSEEQCSSLHEEVYPALQVVTTKMQALCKRDFGYSARLHAKRRTMEMVF
jgi:hypothetical protein